LWVKGTADGESASAAVWREALADDPRRVGTGVMKLTVVDGRWASKGGTIARRGATALDPLMQ